MKFSKFRKWNPLRRLIEEYHICETFDIGGGFVASDCLAPDASDQLPFLRFIAVTVCQLFSSLLILFAVSSLLDFIMFICVIPLFTLSLLQYSDDVDYVNCLNSSKRESEYGSMCLLLFRLHFLSMSQYNGMISPSASLKCNLRHYVSSICN